MYCVIDRIENDVAICETLPEGEKFEIETKNLPSCVKEGDIIKHDKGFVLEKEMTADRHARLRKSYEALWKK